MSVKKRIKIFIEEENLTVTAFEGSINASNGYVNSISKSIGIDKLELIVEKYPNLNLEWLLTGKGKMLKTNYPNTEGSILSVEEKKESYYELNKKYVDLLEEHLKLLKEKEDK